MNDFVFKVSLPGVDVKSAIPEQCAVHSSYPPFKAKVDQPTPHFATLNVRFTTNLPQNTVVTVYSLNHRYGYIPFTIPSIVFLDSGGITEAGIGNVGIGATLSIDAYATATQFIVTMYDDFFWTSSSASLQVSYYIFAENGA